MNIFTSPSFDKSHIQTILRWRWLVLVAGLVFTVVFELLEEHELTDVHLWLDVFIFGLLVPSATWLLLTLLARNLAQQAKTEDYHARYRRFTQQLAQRREWDELTRFVTEFARTIPPIDHSALFIYDHHKARLEFAADWHTSAEAVPAINASLTYDGCQACLLSTPAGMRSAHACSFNLDAVDGRHGAEFCLPLSYDNVLVGILRLMCQPGQTLTEDQVEFLNATAPEIALALAISISYPRQLAQVRTEAQMDERHYIAYVLHNSLAQQIGYLHLSLDRLASDGRLHELGPVREELERLRAVAEDGYERIRNTLAFLRAHEQSDLTQAIVDHTRSVSQRAQLQFEFTTQGNPRLLAPEACQHVVGLLQEGLNNVVKHARAQHVHVTLGWSDDSVQVSMVDDGVGFDSSASRESGHYGITMMQERTQALGGEIALQSAPGEGTRLTLAFPLQRLQAQPRDGSFANPTAST